eukprot:14133003-Ditylum_brightwellii.AAC.1
MATKQFQHSQAVETASQVLRERHTGPAAVLWLWCQLMRRKEKSLVLFSFVNGEGNVQNVLTIDNTGPVLGVHIKGDINMTVLMSSLHYFSLNTYKHDVLLIEEVKTEFKTLKVHLEKQGIVLCHHLQPTISVMHYCKAYHLQTCMWCVIWLTTKSIG